MDSHNAHQPHIMIYLHNTMQLLDSSMCNVQLLKGITLKNTAVYRVTVIFFFFFCMHRTDSYLQLRITNYWPESKSNSGLESSHEAVGWTYQFLVRLHGRFLGKASNAILNEDDGHRPQPQKGKPHNEKCKRTYSIMCDVRFLYN